MAAKFLLPSAAVLWWAGLASAQTTLNPDISLIGEMLGTVHNDPAFPSQEGKFQLQDPGLELVIGGYLNPYARADAVISWEGEAEVEEAYATFMRGLPLNTNLRVGQYLLDFGHLNPNHPHVYPFMHRPLPHTEFFGEEGLRDVALRASWLLPTGSTFTEAQLGVLQGTLLPKPPPDPTDSTLEESDATHLAYFGRVGASLATSDFAELAFGVSGLAATYDPVNSQQAWTAGADLKYRWKPNRNTSFQFESEFLWQKHEHRAGGDIQSVGAYGYADYRFRQRFNLGGIAEFTEAAFDPDPSVWSAGLFAGFSPVEETSVVRILADWTAPEGGEGYWTVNLQLVFGLGPHQPHTF